MSIKAYLIKEMNMKTENEQIKIEKTIEREPTLYLTKNSAIFDLIQKQKLDNLNEDLNGEIVIDKTSWKEILHELNMSNIKKYEKNSINKINNEFKTKDILFFECF